MCFASVQRQKVRVSAHLRQILLAERTVWIVVQAALQTLEAERVTAGSGDWLVKQSVGMEQKPSKFLTLQKQEPLKYF